MNNSTEMDLQMDCFYDWYGAASVVILGLVSPPIICFGLSANVLSVRIFTHRMMRNTPINWYLTVLSCSDFLILVSSFLMLSLPRFGEYVHAFWAIRLSYFITPIGYALALTAQTTSVYMTVLMSAHRFVGVCFPFKAPNILTRKRVKMAIGGLLAFSILFNVMRFLEVKVVGTCFAPEIQDTVVVLMPTELRFDPTYQTVFFGFVKTIVMFIFPFTALIVMNTKVVHAVHRTRRLHERMNQGDDAAKRQQLAKEISTSVMLIGIVVVFLTCNVLAFSLNVIEVLKLIPRQRYSIVVDISNLLVTINGSINIFVYCLFSEKYRALLKYFLCCYWLREGEMLLTALD